MTIDCRAQAARLQNPITEARMFAVLSATNEAILRSSSQDDVFQRVCDAAVAGGFRGAGALLVDSDNWLQVAAVAGGDGRDRFASLRISVDPETERGRGLAGNAFRSGRSCFSNDFQTDDRFRPWREENRGRVVGAAAAVPILQNGASIGVFMFFLGAGEAFNAEVVALIERMVENVSFALHNFLREDERKKSERASRRVSDMFAALSATNTSILRARDQAEMFAMVCDSVARGGRSLGAAAVFMKDPESHWLRPVAASGQLVHVIEEMPLSVDPDDTYGHGLHGPAFREQTLEISYDTAADPRTQLWVQPGSVPHGCAAVPLITGGKSVGILFFFFARTSGREDDGIRQLMLDIAANVSFGLEAFAREQHKERITRMFAALSATNEAIMRARSRDELLQMACDAAVLGDMFICARMALLAPDGQNLCIGAAGGRGKETATGIMIPLSPGEEAVSVGEIAFKTGKPSICNDYLADPRMTEFRERLREFGTRAVAAFPLFRRGETIGQITLQAGECNAFSPELADLLQRLADNVSFALENFDRADEKREAEQRIKYLATHDGLTGLPNRVMFNQLLESSVELSWRQGSKCAVLFIDLDRFKVINDSLGHDAGDALLVEVASRLRGAVREGDVVARLGGDEFVVILREVENREQVAQVARKLLSALVPSLTLTGHECRVTGSIGIAMYPDNGTDAHTLTKNADMAMYLAKEEGKNDYRFFSAEIRSQSIERLMLETNLRRALELNQFSLHYQPKINAGNGEINGVEALLRWNHPDLGSLSPLKFIPLAEETGLIIPIGRWVLKTACEQNMAWQRQGLPAVSMAVNLSPRQFLDDGLLADIDDVLAETGMPAQLLQLEITESMVMQNVERGIELLDAIQSRGIRLAIDDFGTGYSSMSMMKRFPIDTIKIDRSFVRDLDTNAEDRAIATAIISMGKALGLTVVAEGVETSEQDAFLRGRACDELQGYLFSRPVPPEQVPELLLRAVPSPGLQPFELEFAPAA